MNYTTLLFDVFDTVIHIDESKLPTHDVGGKGVPATAPAVHSAYCTIFGKKEFDVFYGAFSQSDMQVSTRRRIDLKEIVSQQRFRIMLRLLKHPTGEVTDEVLEVRTRAHMQLLEKSFEVRRIERRHGRCVGRNRSAGLDATRNRRTQVETYLYRQSVVRRH